MALKKLVNRASNQIQVSLYVRKGGNVGRDAAEERFVLEPGQTKEVNYGTTNDRLLNGMGLVEMHEKEIMSATEVFIVKANNALDNLLNGNDTLEISVEGSTIQIKPG